MGLLWRAEEGSEDSMPYSPAGLTQRIEVLYETETQTAVAARTRARAAINNATRLFSVAASMASDASETLSATTPLHDGGAHGAGGDDGDGGGCHVGFE